MKYETVKEYLDRGGKITFLPPRHYKEQKIVYKESLLNGEIDVC